MKRLRWDVQQPAASKHPYRDSAIVYAFMAGILVAVTALTGGSVVKGVIVGLIVFVVATAYNWLRVRARLRRREGGER